MVNTSHLWPGKPHKWFVYESDLTQSSVPQLPLTTYTCDRVQAYKTCQSVVMTTVKALDVMSVRNQSTFVQAAVFPGTW